MRRRAGALPNHYLRKERELRGWSQQNVAKRIGVDRYYISRWERGIVAPSAYYRVRLCALFEKNAQELGLLAPNLEALQHPSTKPSPVWLVPHRRNRYFTGREAFLSMLCSKLSVDEAQDPYLPIALCGLSGTGKTQTAIEFAYRFRARYQSVLWIGASSHETLLAQSQQVANLLGLPLHSVQDPHHAVAALREWLQRTPGWLLIIDDLEEFRLLDDLLPTEHRGQLLLTSRNQVLGPLVDPLNMEVLSLEEGMLLLLRRTRVVDLEQDLRAISPEVCAQAQAIVEEMGGLPLALEQAGAYIDETKCGMQAYLSTYRRERSALLRLRSNAGDDASQSLMASLTLSIERAISLHPSVGDLLRLCAFLHPDAIPLEVFTVGTDTQHADGAQDFPSVMDMLELDQVIRVLRRFSLVDRYPQTNTLSMHCLVQVAVRAGLGIEQERIWGEHAIRVVHAFLPEEEPQTEDWRQRWLRILPHVLQCAAWISSEKVVYPDAIDFLYQIGVFLLTSALYDEAERIYEQALSLCEQKLGSEHVRTGEILNDLAVLYWYQGRYSEAEPLFERALRICERIFGRRHIIVLHILHNQALLYAGQGHVTYAEDLLREVVQLREDVLGSSHPHVAESLHELSRIVRQQQRLEDAEALARCALAICQQSLGEAHPLLARILTHLGKVLAARGQVEQAVELVLQALYIREKIQGTTHPDIAICLNVLGDLYYLQSQFDLAEDALQRAWHIRDRALPAEHPLRAETLHSLAQLASTQRNEERELR